MSWGESEDDVGDLRNYGGLGMTPTRYLDCRVDACSSRIEAGDISDRKRIAIFKGWFLGVAGSYCPEHREQCAAAAEVEDEEPLRCPYCGLLPSESRIGGYGDCLCQD